MVRMYVSTQYLQSSIEKFFDVYKVFELQQMNKNRLYNVSVVG